MSQKQLKAFLKPEEFGPQATGNYAAKIAAEKARDILAQPVELTRDERLKSIHDHIKKKGATRIYGFGSGSAEDFIKNKYEAERLMTLIESGEVDEKTLQWVNKHFGHKGMICFCLVPGCVIGHFIPIRVSVDT